AATCPTLLNSLEIPTELGDVPDPLQNIFNFSMFTSGYGFVDGTVSLTSIESSFVESCFGNGGVSAGCTSCPCGNDAPSAERGGCSNSAGASARLIARGRPSVSDDTLSVELRGAAPNTFAILSSGASLAPANAANPCFGLNSGITSPFFDGLRCVVQDILRHGTRATDAQGGVGVTTAGFGPPWGPAGGLLAANGFVAGQTRHFQIVYRDDPMLGCGTGQNTTQAVSIEMLP
ncbi:MAG: hypothetical protein AAF368_09605, partial [Planctomycetota bacterium]